MESAVVKRFFDLNNKDQEKVVKAVKILIKLIQNAQNEDEDKFQRIRLGNPKIQQNVLSQIGALDILIHVGFVKMKSKEDDGENVLIYGSTRERKKLALDIVRQLETRLARFEASPSAARNKGTPFLTAKESKERQALAREKRKAEKAAKEEAMKRWQEDKAAREETSSRSTAAKEVAVQTGRGKIASGPHIQIRRDENPSKLVTSQSTTTGPASISHPKKASIPRPNAKTPDIGVADEEKKTPAVPQPQNCKQEIGMVASQGGSDISSSLPVMDDAEWASHLGHIPLCASAEGIRETSIYWKKSSNASSFSSSSPVCLRKLLRELDELKGSLSADPRCSIWIRFDEETPQYIRSIVTAALPGPTPYCGGCFCFDIYIPDDYPSVPPKVSLLTTGGGTVRFGPNLYKEGKVCLSLLGTWPGPKWNQKISNLSQVLLSIQGLILGAEHPYFLEPGHGGWEGKVKTGDFITTGETLSGKVVKEDCFKLPAEAAIYEDDLRVGTLRYAMLEMIRSLKKQSSLTRYLSPFQLPIRAHFYHNKSLILNEVEAWINSCADRSYPGNSQIMNASSRLQKLSSVLKKELESLEAPSKPAPQPSVCDSVAMTEENVASKRAAQAFASMELDTHEQKPREAASLAGSQDEETDPLEGLKELMNVAAQSNDYIRAGNLQEQIAELEDFRRAMKEAAEQRNFIRAGRLQEQYEARLGAVKELPQEMQKQSKTLKELMSSKPETNSIPPGSGNQDGGMEMDSNDDEMDYNSSSDDEMDDDEEDSDGAQPMAGFPMYPKNWIPPSVSHNHVANPRHKWGGGGRTLAASSEDSEQVASAVTTTAVTQTATTSTKKSRPSSGVACRLRVRLPDAKTLDEEFDGNDTIGDVYRRINPHIRRPASNQDGSKANIAPIMTRTQVATPYGVGMVEAPAFSRPISSNGYTLLLTRPKREFSLEMDGTKSLCEMALVPSAVVTVMMCQERGKVRRGDLEGRLDAAQGDAMDVEGLSYEGLLELTERVGASEKSWTEDDEKALNETSSLLSPTQHLANLSNSNKKSDPNGGDDEADQQERRCPICLGDFDPSETEPILRCLDKCRHSDNTFHEACLRTWMTIKVGCPICKQPCK